MSESTGSMSGNNDQNLTISKIFERIIIDEDFKKRLVEDPDEALKDYQLSEVQMILLKNLDRDDIDKLTPENVEEFFSADSAVYTPDEADEIDAEVYSVEDFDVDDDE